MKYLIDSNIIIYHLNGENFATDFIVNNIKDSAISRITFIEVLSFDFTSEEESIIKDLLNSFQIIDTSEEIALQSIENRKTKKIKVPDNIIASTAQINNLVLVTKNVSDFKSLTIKLLDIFSK
ncbi:MAG: type II toxin-antitoxin system VapC family toxin [Desulfobacterales bacterium]|nr:type II toxin-antitoxin system VapC family toxin [Desulfobacterales bacterium]